MRHNFAKALIFLVSIFSVAITFISLTKFPYIWSDEAIFADIALNIAFENRAYTDLWSGIVPGIESISLFYPPVFLKILAVWFKLFGFSIESQRLLSIFVGVIFVVFYFLLARLWTTIKKNKGKQVFEFLPLIILSMLLVDFVFLRSIKVSRPEILVLCFGSIALLLHKVASDIRDFNRLRTIVDFISGFLLR